MIADPSLRFWLHAVQREGALCEFSDDIARTLLPAHLQERLHLPELLSVTADPDAAEEDPDAIFLVPGHPVLESVAARTIDRGDVGHAYLPWPAAVTPGSASLLERARAAIDVEHGRIDLAGDPARIYRPLLRIGVLVTYTLDDHFQEREEVWADAYAGVTLDASAAKRLRTMQSVASPEERCREQSASLTRAVQAIHSALLARIAVRSATLARQSQGTLRDEIARSEAYYDAAQATLERRRAHVEPDRRALLDKQAEALEAERRRRRHEIETNSSVSYALQPYRAHLLRVPALSLPVTIRRGERRYPFELCWLLSLGDFSPPVCPACGMRAQLIAERDRLACAACRR